MQNSTMRSNTPLGFVAGGYSASSIYMYTVYIQGTQRNMEDMKGQTYGFQERTKSALFVVRIIFSISSR